jgi:enamine deaminase RidA (YjgF/YER057c/UK114 family)
MGDSPVRRFSHPSAVGAEPGAWSHAVSIDLASVSRLVFIAGQTALNENGDFSDAGDLRQQFDRVYDNIEHVLAANGATFADVVAYRTFLAKQVEAGHFRRLRNERHRRLYPDGDAPPNTLVVCDRLAEPEILLEIEVIAAV